MSICECTDVFEGKCTYMHTDREKDYIHKYYSINIKHWSTDYVVQAGVSEGVVQVCIGQVNICIYV